jgi:hypothetical protein
MISSSCLDYAHGKGFTGKEATNMSGAQFEMKYMQRLGKGSIYYLHTAGASLVSFFVFFE